MTTEKTTRTIYTTYETSGLLVYMDAETMMAACITIDGLRLAHDAEIRIGCHPYASATAWTPIVLLPTLATPAVMAPDDAPIAEDWLDWCDDVFARHAEHHAEESIASSAQQTGAITDTRYLDEINAAA